MNRIQFLQWCCPCCKGNRGILVKKEETLSWEVCTECSATGIQRSQLDYALAQTGLSGDGTIDQWNTLLSKKKNERRKIELEIEDLESEISSLEDDERMLESLEQLIQAAITYRHVSEGKIPCAGQLPLLEAAES